jgi:hypothetical protein
MQRNCRGVETTSRHTHTELKDLFAGNSRAARPEKHPAALLSFMG